MKQRERITVTIRTDLAARLRMEAELKDTPVSQLVNEAIRVMFDPLDGIGRPDGKAHVR